MFQARKFEGGFGARCLPITKILLDHGARVPGIGLGTFGSDKYTAAQVGAGVIDAVSVGYRHLDCASVYGNEPDVGASLRAILAGGVDRA